MRRAPLFGLFLSLAVSAPAAGRGGVHSVPTVPLAPNVPLAPDSAVRSTDSVTSATGIRRLRGYEVDRDKVFVAGISSGGFFGVQMHVAFSRTFKGAAIYAGGVYHCENDSVLTALFDC